MASTATDNLQAERDANASLSDQVRALAEDAIDGTPLYLVEVVVRGRPGSRVVEVYADADDGAALDTLADVSRRLGFLLDTEDLVKGKYTLNVSSPGADRPLLLARQYPQHVGRTLDVMYTRAGGEETLTARGTLSAAGDDSFTLQTDGGAETTIPYDAVQEARVALPW